MKVPLASLRRIIKGMVGVVCAATMLMSAAPTASAVEASPFVDVNSSTPHVDDINWLAGTKISTGWGNADGTVTFGPMRMVVRQDMAAFLYRLAGSPDFDATKAKNPFSDVTPQTSHYKEILWLASTGIAKGYEDGTFGGMRIVVRQDMAAFLHRMADYTKATPPMGNAMSFTDVTPKTPHTEDIAWLAKTGVTTGWKENDGTYTFRGMNEVIRQDMAAFLQRMARNVLSYTEQGRTTIVVYGLAKNKDGNPIKNAKLTFKGFKAPEVTTDDEGYFTAHLYKGSVYTVSADGLQSQITAYAPAIADVKNTTGSITLGRTVTEGDSKLKVADTAIYIGPDDYTVSDDHKSFTVTNASLNLQVGDNVLFAPQSNFEGKAVVIASIDGSGDHRVINGPQAAMNAVVETLDLAPSEFGADNATFTPADGVTVTSTNATNGTDAASFSAKSQAAPAVDLGDKATPFEAYLKVDMPLTLGKTTKVGYFFSDMNFEMTVSDDIHLDFLHFDKSSITFTADNDYKSWQTLCMSYAAKGYDDTPCAATEANDRDYLWSTDPNKVPPNPTDADTSAPGDNAKFDPIELGKVSYALPLGAVIDVPLELTSQASGHFRVSANAQAGVNASITLKGTSVTSTVTPRLDYETYVSAAVSITGGLRMTPQLRALGFDLAQVYGEAGLGLDAQGRLTTKNNNIIPAESGARYRFYRYVDSQWSLPFLSALEYIKPGHVDWLLVGDTVNDWIDSLNKQIDDVAQYSENQNFPGHKSKNILNETIREGEWDPSQQDAQTVKTVNNDQNFIYTIMGNGDLWTWGKNETGQVGDGSTTNRTEPYHVSQLKNVTSVAAANGSTYAVADGKVWTWGRNDHGQLGDGTTDERHVPKQVDGPANVKSVTAAGSTVFAIDGGGSVWAWGNNNYGQVGNDNTQDQSTPHKVSGPVNVKSVNPSSDAASVYALGEDGSVWAWGSNLYGQIGNGDVGVQLTPYHVTGLPVVSSLTIDGYVQNNDNYAHVEVFAIGEDGSVWAWGKNASGKLGDGTEEQRHKPQQIQGLPAVKSIGFGGNGGGSVYALAQNGQVWSWGRNWNGSLGLGDAVDNGDIVKPQHVEGPEQVQSLSPKGTTLALSKDGTVWTWGNNDYGSVGDGTSDNHRATPYRLQGLGGAASSASAWTVGLAWFGTASYAIGADGSLYNWGFGFSTTPRKVMGVKDVTSIQVTLNGACFAVTSDGNLWTWSTTNYDNDYGEVGRKGDANVPGKVSFI